MDQLVRSSSVCKYLTAAPEGDNISNLVSITHDVTKLVVISLPSLCT